MEVLTEWGVNIYKFKLDENDKILDNIMKHMRNGDFNSIHEWNAKVSYVLSESHTDNKNFEILKFITNKIKNCISHIPNFKGLTFGKPPPFKEDLWINFYKKGDYQDVHHHTEPNIKYSYVYFAKYNHDKDAKLIIGNNKTARGRSCLNTGEILFQLTEEKVIHVQQGDLIIFPSYLLHYVEKQESVGPRITVVGNLFSF